MRKTRFFTTHLGVISVAVLFAGLAAWPRDASGQSVQDPQTTRPAIIYGTCRAEHIEAMIQAAMLNEVEGQACRDAFVAYATALDKLRQLGGDELMAGGALEHRILQIQLMPPNDPSLLFPGDQETNQAPADDPRWVRLRELAAAQRNTSRDLTRRHHDLLRTLFTALQVVLDESGYTVFTSKQFVLVELSDAGADVRLRNQSFLHVDVAALIRQSMIDGVLHDAFDRFALRPEGRLDEAALRTRIDDLLRQYYITLEPLLIDHHLTLPEKVKPEEVIFSYTPSEKQMNDSLKRNGRRWSARHDIDAIAAQQIEFAIAEVAGDGFASRWRRSFEASVAPHLFKRWPSLGIADWFDAQDDVTHDQRIAIRALQDEHDRQYENAAEHAYRMGLAVTRDHGTVHMAGTDIQGHERYWLAVLRFNEISMQLFCRVQPLCGDSQLIRLRQWTPKTVNDFGPRLRRDFLQENDVERALHLHDSLRTFQ